MADSDRQSHVVFTGGGTAGHLFPGLAVAEYLKKIGPELRISFFGSGQPFERQHVEEARFEYRTIPCRPAPARLRAAPSFLWGNWAGYRQAARYLTRQGASLVVGLGGYVSAPTARAALRLRLPLVLMEQNAVAGKVTRWLAPRATVLCTSFAETQLLPDRLDTVRVTGNPVAERVLRYHDKTKLEVANRLLILGGSRGASSLNRHVPEVLAGLMDSLRGWEILHQSGAADQAETAARYESLDLDAQVVPFIQDMGAMLAGTRLAICRAGGTTLAELAAAGVPAITIPYPYAADDHQRENALAYVAKQGCRLVTSPEKGGILADELGELLTAPDRLTEMGRSMRRLARPKAAADVADCIRQLLGSHGRTRRGWLVDR